MVSAPLLSLVLALAASEDPVVRPAAGLGEPARLVLTTAFPSSPILARRSRCSAKEPSPRSASAAEPTASRSRALLPGSFRTDVAPAPPTVPLVDPIELTDDERRWSSYQPAPGKAGNGEFYVARGWYLGPQGAYVQITDQDLDGSSQLMGTDTISLPENDPGFGGGGVLGYRFERTAFELAYTRTEHDATFMGAPVDTRYKSFGITFKQFFLTRNRFQPFLSLGFANSRLDIKNGAQMGATTADAKLEDEISVNAGAGLSFYFTTRLALSVRAEYRFLNAFDEATGVAPKGPTTEIDAGGVTALASLTYTF